MLIEELDIFERVEAYKLIGFPEFLEERPSSDDFGESLDLYRKKLMKKNKMLFLEVQTKSM